MKDKDVVRVAQMLKAAVRFTGVSHRKIEREMELSTGYLSRILSGKVELRIQHVLGVCRAIGLPPSAFFEAAYPSRELDAETARLVAALQELLPAEDAAPRAKVRKAGPPPRPPASKAARQAPRTATSQLRRLLEAVLLEMQEQGEDDQEEA